MKLVSLATALITCLLWGAILLTRIPQLDLLACVMLPEHSISSTIWFEVVIPTAMTTISAISLLLILMGKPARGASLAAPFVTLVCLPIYYLFVTGVSITQTAIDACSV